MAGGIDHLVLCVRDLAQARERYRRFGFTLTPPARHPFGTANSLVQFAERSFLELLTVADPNAIPPMQPGFFSFGAYNRDFLKLREGCSMLVSESGNAEADSQAYRAAGLGDFAPFYFERPAKLPDGSLATVAFTLAFAVDSRLPEAAFFACQQHAPELFWKADYQRHANGALGIEEVALVAANPVELSLLFGTLTRSSVIDVDADGLSARTARGVLRALTPAAFSRRYAGAAPPALTRGPRFAGCYISVENLDAVRALLAPGGVDFSESDGTLVIRPGDAFEFALGFVQRSKR